MFRKPSFIGLLTLLIAGQCGAQEFGDLYQSPYDPSITYRQEAATYIQHVENSWSLYQISEKSLQKIEDTARAEYHAPTFDWSLQLDLDRLRPRVLTRIQFFGKPIFFEFTVTD